LKFTPTVPNPIEYNYGLRSVAVGDFNNDNWSDIVVANRAINSIAVFLGHGDGRFGSQTMYPTGSYSTPYMVAVGDFNNDHRLDIAVANVGTNNIGIFMGFGNGSFTSQILISTGSSRPFWIHIADLNNDTLLDLITANYDTDSVSILFGYGNGSFAHPIIYSTGYDSLPFSVIAGDFNNDNHLDLVIANYGTNNIAILFANGNGNFSYQNTFTTGINSHPYSIIVGHFNDDILLDIAVANYGTNNVGILLGNGNGTFANQTTYLLHSASPYSIGVGDFNRDHQLDIVVTNKGINNVGLLQGRGDGTFTQATMYSTGSSSSISVAVADFNNDNLLDITIINNDTNNIGILFSYNDDFSNQRTYSTGTGPFSVAVCDFNNEAQLDIVVTNYFGNNIGVLL